jgi:hypothetical protein
MPLDPETARALLNVLHPDEEDTGNDQQTWLHFYVQSQLMGRPWRGEPREESAEYKRREQRSRRISELHTQTFAHPEDTTAHQEELRLIKEIFSEGQAELEELLEQIERGDRTDLWTP